MTARDVARTFSHKEIYQMLEEKMMQLKKPVQMEQPIQEHVPQEGLLQVNHYLKYCPISLHLIP